MYVQLNRIEQYRVSHSAIAEEPGTQTALRCVYS